MTAIPKDCGFSTALRIIGGKWKVEILCELQTAPRRFGRLRQLIPGIQREDAGATIARDGGGWGGAPRGP